MQYGRATACASSPAAPSRPSPAARDRDQLAALAGHRPAGRGPGGRGRSAPDGTIEAVGSRTPRPSPWACSGIPNTSRMLDDFDPPRFAAFGGPPRLRAAAVDASQRPRTEARGSGAERPAHRAPRPVRFPAPIALHPAKSNSFVKSRRPQAAVPRKDASPAVLSCLFAEMRTPGSPRPGVPFLSGLTAAGGGRLPRKPDSRR